MPASAYLPTIDQVVADLRVLRERGLTRIRHADLPSLRLVATETAPLAQAQPQVGLGGPSGQARPAGTASGHLEVEVVLRAAVENLGGGELGGAAMATFGLDKGTRDRPAQDRRRRAALIYGVSVERFRKHHERIVLEQVAEEMLKLALRPQAGAKTPARPVGQASPSARTVLSGQVGGRDLRVTVRIEPVELLTGADILVVPTNSYMELPQHFKSSVSAAVRKMAAVRNSDGQVVIDVVADELASWMSKNARPGLPVAPGTVAATTPGEMTRSGIRRIYHVATTSPQPRSNDYVVEPSAVADGIRNVFTTARSERALFRPPLNSIALPLLGAGRGGLDPATSFDWIWSAVERELSADDAWDIHFFTRTPERVEVMIGRLAAAGLV